MYMYPNSHIHMTCKISMPFSLERLVSRQVIRFWKVNHFPKSVFVNFYNSECSVILFVQYTTISKSYLSCSLHAFGYLIIIMLKVVEYVTLSLYTIIFDASINKIYFWAQMMYALVDIKGHSTVIFIYYFIFFLLILQFCLKLSFGCTAMWSCNIVE